MPGGAAFICPGDAARSAQLLRCGVVFRKRLRSHRGHAGPGTVRSVFRAHLVIALVIIGCMTAEPSQPVPLRASDADREAVVAELQEAAADGRIDLDELGTRLEVALAARTHAELAPLTADLLPVMPPAQPLLVKGGMAGAVRDGIWRVPAQIRAYGGLGGVKIDFTRVECRLRVVEVEVNGGAGGVEIVVPDGWVVETGEVDPGLAGLRNRTTAERLPGSPLIRLSGDCGMGGVTVRHPERGERRKLQRESR